MATFLNIPIERLCVTPATPLHDVIECIQTAEKQIALVVDENGRLLGTITDGDVRRAMLRNLSMETPAGEVMHTSFTAGRAGMSTVEVFALMQSRFRLHVPLVDENGVLVDLAWISDLIKREKETVSALVMAGGFGKRLRPFTEDVPKPMLPVGDRPLMEYTVAQLREAGIRHVSIATHFMSEKIKEHFGDGGRHGVDIHYVSEEEPLGTAGALGLMPAPDGPLLVINGDILTGIDFRAMLAFHREHNADLTVGVRKCGIEVPYGVVETDGVCITRIEEKPLYTFFVNAGIYLLGPAVHRGIPPGERLDMTELIDLLIGQGQTVVSFPILEYWLDIGKPADYQRAQEDVQNGRVGR